MKYNLFCDASMDNKNHIGCAGVIITNGDGSETISGIRLLQQNATNNSVEILAIYIAVNLAIVLRKSYDDIFNIFSDSKISVFGLKEWVFNWIKKCDINGILYSSSGDPVKNQDYFKQIIRLIVDNDLKINLFHQNGHINPSNINDVNLLYNTFVRNNLVEPNFIGIKISTIIYYNDIIDRWTREAFNESNIYYEDINYKPKNVKITESDLLKYDSLLNTYLI